MTKLRVRARRWLLGVLVAAGPLYVAFSGVPIVWGVNPVPFSPDQGKLGKLSNAAAVAVAEDAFGAWAAVPTSALRFTNAGSLPVDITAGNYVPYISGCGPGDPALSPIVFDDGSITDLIFGEGGRDSIAGFAGASCIAGNPPVITKAYAVLNGRMIDGVASGLNNELPMAGFLGLLVHEFGHFVGLDHSQIGYADSRDADSSNDAAVATMFNIILPGGEQATPAVDDEVSISTLYPAPSFATGFGTITGHVFLQDGTTPFQDAFVIARNVADPRLTAVGIVSGARSYPGSPDAPPELQGLFELPGLPPGSYTVEIEEVHFQGFSHIGPVYPVPKLPGPPEFWNGANEAATDPPDDPAEFEVVGVSAGATRSGIDFVINDRPVNDDCVDAKEVAPFLSGDFVNTVRATTEPSDPIQSCGVGGPGQNARSVWYRLTPPTDGVISRVDSSATDYSTVITLYTGPCGNLTEQACVISQGNPSYISEVPVVGGRTYLFEVTDGGTGAGGSLVFSSQFIPANPICRGGVSIGRGFSMTAAGIGPPAGDERLVVRGRLPFAADTPPVFDPMSTGAQVLVESIPTFAGSFTVFDLTHRTSPIPGGGPGTGCAPADGWRAVGESLVYTNRSNALPPACQPGSANGLVRLKLRDQRPLGRGISFQMRTRSSIVPLPQTPGRFTFVLGGTAASGLGGGCGEGQMGEGGCDFSSNGSRLDCR